MGRVNFNYSLKNIPLPNKDTCRKNLIQKVESFIKRIRWKAFFFERQCKHNDQATLILDLNQLKSHPKMPTEINLKVTCAT